MNIIDVCNFNELAWELLVCNGTPVQFATKNQNKEEVGGGWVAGVSIIPKNVVFMKFNDF